MGAEWRRQRCGVVPPVPPGLLSLTASAGAGLGNNIWPAVPQLGDVLRSAVVHGGLQSILGEGYTMNAHRHMHNSSTQGDQAFHKDTGWSATFIG